MHLLCSVAKTMATEGMRYTSWLLLSQNWHAFQRKHLNIAVQHKNNRLSMHVVFCLKLADCSKHQFNDMSWNISSSITFLIWRIATFSITIFNATNIATFLKKQ
uniref:Uncharacterized protein n=1 Tax=Opuntia streptacantha TaxID=393608 RepID=A0A7C9AZC8_OPUST